MSAPEIDRAAVVRWMLDNHVGPKAAIEHFALKVDVRTVQIWRRKYGEGAPVAPDPRERALELLAAGSRISEVAQQLGIRSSRIQGWIVAWALDHTEDEAIERFNVPLVALREWTQREAIPDLVLTEAGTIRGIFENATKILDHIQDAAEPAFGLRQNLFTLRVEIRPPGSSTWTSMTDTHLRHIKEFLSDAHGCQVSWYDLQQAVLRTAEGAPHHPVREYLEGLSWDGERRVERVLDWYFGCEADDLSATMGRRWLVSAVARVMQPPCKVDTVLVLHGPQGAGKSTAFRALAGEDWFTDAPLDFSRNADTAMLLQGRWFVELGELDSLTRSEITTTKAFITREIDSFRAPYARNAEDVPRQSILVGSTNEAQFLVDPTGNRRFWVRRVVDRIRVDDIEDARDQLWAEAFQLYSSGLPWWLTDEEQARAVQATRPFEWSDAWADPIADWLDRTPGAQPTSAEVLELALRVPPGSTTQRELRRVANVMRQLGYDLARPREGGSRVRRWVLP